MSVSRDPDGHAAERLFLVWNGRIEELAGERPRTPASSTDRRAETECTPGCHYTPDNADRPKEREMRGAFTSIQMGLATYSEDLTLNANAQLGDSGACRRR